MKDQQTAPVVPGLGVFLISAVLHCVGMTALVYLRSSFGFGFLRPKSFFFACSWAFGLYAVYAWIDGAVWRQRPGLIVFGCFAILLYWTHLLIAFVREWKQIGEHDRYSGTSHLVWLLRKLGRAPTPVFEARIHLWGEPLLTLLFSGILRVSFGPSSFAEWLGIVAVCLWSRETMNQWYRIRQRKRRRDVYEDTEEVVEPSAAGNPNTEPPRATRKVKVKRDRVTEP